MLFSKCLYTFEEIAINHNMPSYDIRKISKMSDKKQLNEIFKKYEFLKKFAPYCDSYKLDGKNVYAIPAYIYDVYTDTGNLINTEIYDEQPSKNKLEYWQYTSPICLELKLKEDWEFANSLIEEKYKGISSEELWNVFLSGCARMDYYQESQVDIQRRVKYAILEYMMKRPQFFYTSDFIDNPVLHLKYGKEGVENGKK